MNNSKTNKAVDWAVSRDVHYAVNKAVDRKVYWAVDNAVGNTVGDAVWRRSNEQL